MKEIFQNLANILKNKTPDQKIGSIYAINSGKYVGEFFVLVEKTNLEYKFLSIPKMVQRVVPRDAMGRGLKGNIITLVKRLPKPIFDICRKQYYYTISQNKIVDKKNDKDK